MKASMENTEIWRPIKGYEGLYIVSNTGKVKSVSRVCVKKNGAHCKIPEKEKKQTVLKIGYYVVRLWKNNSSQLEYVHRLVAEAFLIRLKGCDYVNHINGNKQDNHIDNLEWCTQKHNIQHAYDNNLYKSRNIAAIDPSTLEIEKIYSNAAIAARETGASRTVICRCCRTGRGTSGGHIWRFLNQNSIQ